MTKGYKATYNYQCRNQMYEIGQEYKLDEEPIICLRGFHYCKNAKDTLKYYSYNQKLKLLEIEDLSAVSVVDYDKSCSNHIKIIREIVDLEELFELLGCVYTYNESGQELYHKNSDGFWHQQTYNALGKILTYKNSNGFWREFTYDLNGNQLINKESDGFYSESTYDENGRKLTYKNSYGYSTQYTYDKNGIILTQKSGSDND